MFKTFTRSATKILHLWKAQTFRWTKRCTATL